MKKLLVLLAVLVIGAFAFAQIADTVLLPPGAGETPIHGDFNWEWANPGPAATKTDVHLEILPQVGLAVYPTLDLGPVCIMNDFSRIWDFQFYTKNNCNAMFGIHWDFITMEPTCTQTVTGEQLEDIALSVTNALELWYLGFYKWDYDTGEMDPNFIAPLEPIQLMASNPTTFFIERCFRQHWLRFHWGKTWDECIGDWCLNMPAGDYYFVIDYTIEAYCPEEPPAGDDDVPDYDCTDWGNIG